MGLHFILPVIFQCVLAGPPRVEDWNAWRKDTTKFVTKTSHGEFKYYVHTPPGYKEAKAAGKTFPVLVVLHWSFVTGPEYLHYWREDTDRRGVILVAPNSRGRGSWLPSDADDIEVMLREVRKNYATEAGRTWVAGYSAGAVYIYYLLFTHPDLFDAALPNGGRIKRHRALVPTSTSKKKTRLCIFHGAWDKNIRFSEAEHDVGVLKGVGYDVKLHPIERFGHWIPRDLGDAMIDCLDGK